MLILGIESSCDETAAAVVSDGRDILSSSVASQIATHRKYGGVVPELASREHLRAIVPVVDEALFLAGASYKDLGAIAATQGPGLVGSLLVGITYAKAICFAHQLPLIAVNHLEGHIHAVLMEHPEIELPGLALIVSGGHTHMYELSTDLRYTPLGATRDDAAGEAYDKVAKLLGFPYPGGPVLDQLAPYGDPSGVRFSLTRMKGNPLDFSFSGLKTAVLRWVEANALEDEIRVRRAFFREHTNSRPADWLEVTPRATLDCIASFQATVIKEIYLRLQAIAAERPVRSIIISGGVACNRGLRAAANAAALPGPVYFPAVELSTDNAAMIAAAAFPRFQRGEFASFKLKARSSFALGAAMI